MEGLERARKPRKPASDRFGRLTLKETFRPMNDAVQWTGKNGLGFGLLCTAMEFSTVYHKVLSMSPVVFHG